MGPTSCVRLWGVWLAAGAMDGVILHRFLRPVYARPVICDSMFDPLYWVLILNKYTCIPWPAFFTLPGSGTVGCPEYNYFGLFKGIRGVSMFFFSVKNNVVTWIFA